MDLTYAAFASSIAIILSLVALYEVGSHRTRGIAKQAQREIAIMKGGLDGAEARIADASLQWKAALAARGLLQSAVMKQKEQAAEDLRSRAAVLFEEINGLRVPTKPILSSFLIDECAAVVGTCLLKWDLLDFDINAFVAEAKASRAQLSRT